MQPARGVRPLTCVRRVPRVYLEMDRLILRYLRAENVGQLFDLDSDPEAMRYSNNGRLHAREEIVETFLPY